MVNKDNYLSDDGSDAKLRVERKDLDECSSTHVELALTADIPPVGEIGSPLDDGPPRWKEVQEVEHCARAASW